ncbi:MAG: nucleoside deaminase, partial [Methanobacterium sp.]|nr:nucleoside deaminase [Methanobacterium sp.]
MCERCPDPVAEPFAAQSVQLAEQATEANTFGVGGVLLDSSGKIWAAERNQVLKDKVINDPTAHGERQLVSWYYARLADGADIPKPSEMTIVTSLDPCVMCTGALLTSGINVAVVAHDTFAGIDYAGNEEFLTVPADIRPLALQQFSYFGLSDGSRSFAGSSSSIFNGQSISADLNTQSLDTFNQSVEVTREIVNGEDPTPYNIATLGPDSPQLKLLRQYYPLAVTLNVDLATNPAPLLEPMLRVAKASHQAGNAFNSAALVDPFGNVLLVIGNNQGSCKIDTSFLLLTRSYAQCRRNDDNAKDGALPHPKRCQIILLHGPDQGTESLMDLGAYGSTMEGPLPSDNPDNLLYIVPRPPPSALAAMSDALP